MAVYLKPLFTTTLILFTLTACKPGVYYPFGDTRAQQGNTSPSHQTAAASPKLGELTTTNIIAG